MGGAAGIQALTLTMLREKPVKISARIVRLVATPCFSISVARNTGWQPDGPGASRDRPRISEQCRNVGAGVRPRFCAISELVQNRLAVNGIQ